MYVFVKGTRIRVGEWGGERKARERRGRGGQRVVRVSETEQHVRVYGIHPSRL